MQTEIDSVQLKLMVRRQLENHFIPLSDAEQAALNTAVDQALLRCAHCFSHNQNKYYRKNGVCYFNPFHSGQYSIFLYFLSHTLFRHNPELSTLADRTYYLNKALNGLDLFYEIELPAIFSVEHPVGTVMGRAQYSDHFSFSQNCTVGNNHGIYPRIGRNVQMHAGSKILGNSCIGDNVILAANACVLDTDIPSCSLVFGASPHLTIKQRDESHFLKAAQPPATSPNQADKL